LASEPLRRLFPLDRSGPQSVTVPADCDVAVRACSWRSARSGRRYRLLSCSLLACCFAWWPWPRSPNPHHACRDACTTTSPALGPGGAATKEEAVNTDSNARFGGEVEGNVSGTAISFGRKPRSPSAVKTRQLFSQQLKDPLTTVIAARCQERTSRRQPLGLARQPVRGVAERPSSRSRTSSSSQPRAKRCSLS
jgi:hypothetical protein